MKTDYVRYSCDRCERTLDGFANELTIVTSLSEANLGWSRLRVTVLRHSGMHNDASLKPADLCQKCAIFLLEDALERVRQGERASVGVESTSVEHFSRTTKE